MGKRVLNVFRKVNSLSCTISPFSNLSLELDFGDTKDHLDGVLGAGSEAACECDILADNVLNAAVTILEVSVVGSYIIGNLDIDGSGSVGRNHGIVLAVNNYILLN